MKSIVPLIFLGFFLLLVRSGNSQDFSYSQFYTHRLSLNPSLAGIEKGLTLTGISRLQWLNVDTGFKIVGLSAEIQEPYINSGFGFQVYQSSEGIFNYNTAGAGITYAYTLGGPKTNFHMGLQIRGEQKSIDWSQLIFSDELDQVFGAILPTTFTPGVEQVSLLDMDFGFAFRWTNPMKLKKDRIRGEKQNLIGLSIHHLPSLFQESGSDESLLNLGTKVTPRITFHAGQIIPLTFLEGVGNEISISPNIRFDMQGESLLRPSENLTLFSIGTYFIYHQLYFGGFYQNQNINPFLTKDTNTWTLVLGGALNYDPKSRSNNRLLFGLSIDFNSSGVGTKAGNVYEFSLRYSFGNVPGLFGKSDKNPSKRILDCKKFY